MDALVPESAAFGYIDQELVLLQIMAATAVARLRPEQRGLQPGQDRGVVHLKALAMALR